MQSYNNNYTYNTVNPQSNTFAPESANDNGIVFEFGINGSLRKRTVADSNKTEFYLFNAFDQMKAYSDNGETYGYYGYDDAGQRMYKVQLKATELYNNRLGGKMLDVDKIMLYPNGYINIDQNGNYTKHYYADAARVASKIGSGSEKLISCVTDSSQFVYAFEIMKKELSELRGDTIDNIVYQLDTIQYLQGDSGNYESDLYFYHGNHLSSTQMITDMQGDVTQAVLYTPHGQVISEYRQDWKLDTIPRYLFSGKATDAESGMSYFEARYFDPSHMIFISPDPLFEKYFWVSRYAYAANNPVKNIDPDGCDWFENEKTGAVYYNSEMGKNDAGTGKMTGEGWKHMGENGMFTQKDGITGSDHDLVANNGGSFSTGVQFNGIHDAPKKYLTMEMMLEGGGQAESFMSKQGYDKKPLVADVKIVENTTTHPDAMGPCVVTITNPDEWIKQVYSWTYAKKGSKGDYSVLKTLEYQRDVTMKFPLSMTENRLERRKYDYSKSRGFMSSNTFGSLLKMGADIFSMWFDRKK